MFYLKLLLLGLFLFSSPSSWSMSHLSTQTENSPIVGKQASDAILPKTDGTSSGVIASLQGKKAIMIFWATWCPHCYEEIGGINDHFAAIEQRGIKIILMDVGESRDDVQAYFKRRNLKLVSFLDEDSVLQEPYYLRGVPTLIFIDEKGVIRSVTHEFPSDYANYFK